MAHDPVLPKNDEKDKNQPLIHNVDGTQIVDPNNPDAAVNKATQKEADLKKKSVAEEAQDFRNNLRDATPMDLDDNDKKNPAVQAALARGEHLMKFKSYADVADHFGNNAAKSSEGAAIFYNMMEKNKNDPKFAPLLEEELKKQIDHATTDKAKKTLGTIAAQYYADNGQNISSPELKAFFEQQENTYGSKKDGKAAAPEGFTAWSKDGKVPEFVENLKNYIDGRIEHMNSGDLAPAPAGGVQIQSPHKGVLGKI